MAENWPIEGRTVRLAHAPPERPGLPRVFAVPPTVDGVVNIGMEGSVHLPSLADQESGFTPYVMRGGEAADATALLLGQFPGVYKPMTEKGVTKP